MELSEKSVYMSNKCQMVKEHFEFSDNVANDNISDSISPIEKVLSGMEIGTNVMVQKESKESGERATD